MTILMSVIQDNLRINMGAALGVGAWKYTRQAHLAALPYQVNILLGKPFDCLALSLTALLLPCFVFLAALLPCLIR
jgi:hypothetical protein